jgi:hypothetical protein
MGMRQILSKANTSMCTELKALKNAIVPALQHASEIEKIVLSYRPDLCMIKDVINTKDFHCSARNDFSAK